MKKLLVILAAVAWTSSVLAQNVTISGSMEAGVKSSNAHVTSIGGSKSDRNQITFAGREDLGNGLSANFVLQNRFDIGNGGTSQTNSLTSTAPETFEQSAVGLSSNTLGEVRLGRFTNVLGRNGFRYWLQEDSPYGAQNTTQYSRLSSQVEYTTPKFKGFSYTVTKADLSGNKYISFVAGNGTTTTTDISNSGNNLTATTLTYDQGPVFATYSVVSGFASESSTRLAGAYRINDNFRVAAGQFNQKDPWQTQLAHKNNYYGVEYSVGKWVTAVTTSKADAKAAATHSGEVEKTGVKAYYSLSKRTTLQYEVAQTKNTTAALDGTAYFVGLRHVF